MGGWLRNGFVGGERRHQTWWLRAAEVQKVVLMGEAAVRKRLTLEFARLAVVS